MQSCVILALLLAAVAAESPVADFTGDKVFHITPKTSAHVKWLQKLRDNGDPSDYDFWNKPNVVNVPVDIHVSKAALDKFQKDVKKAGMKPTIGIEDLQKVINDADEPPASSARPRLLASGQGRSNILSNFPRYNDILTWVQSLCKDNASIATCGNIGGTFENRTIPYVKLSTGNSQSKKIIVIESGLHAREWLGITTGVYLLNRMITTYSSDPVAKKMLDTYDWIFIPLMNPDGYEFSRSNRMWRKNRVRRKGVSCIGVDLNRNYDAWWGLSGSSTNACSDVYRGPSIFSELETKAESVFLNERKDQILAFFTIHTFSQMWLVPYGDRSGHFPPDYAETLRVAQIGTKALKAVNKAQWVAGNTVSVLGAASGCGDDYAKKIGIKYSYTLELRPNGGNGFVVPASAIEPSGKEVWAGVTAAVDAMKI